MALAEWENPTYDTDLEPPELKRLRCQACAAQWARVQCQLCSQQFCSGCEANVHKKLHDAAAHQASLGPCNVCEDCGGRGSEFYCTDCGRYQCEGCCAASHLVDERLKSHVWFCTEGASSRQLRFSKWAPTYVEQVKMARRNAQLEMEKQLAMKQEPAVLPDYIPLPAVGSPDEDEDATSDEEEFIGNTGDVPVQDTVAIKMEQVRLSEQEAEARDALSAPVTEEAAVEESAPEAEPVPVKSEIPSEGPSQSAEMDAEETGGGEQGEQSLQDGASEAVGKEQDGESRQIDPDVPAASEDVQVKDESTAQSVEKPPASADTDEVMKAEHEEDADVVFVEPLPVAADVVDLTGDDDDEENVPPVHSNVKKEEPKWPRAASIDFSLDSDPIRCQLVKAYNSQTKHIHEAEQHSVRLTQRATSATNFQEIQDCKQQLDSLKTAAASATQSRDATLARLLVYMKHGDPDFQKLLVESTLNIPDAETAIHRECARLQSAINAKGTELQQCRAQVDEAIRMKPTESFAEVLRLGTEIAALEKSIHELEKTRLDQLGNLCYVSEAIRAAARAMMASS